MTTQNDPTNKTPKTLIPADEVLNILNITKDEFDGIANDIAAHVDGPGEKNAGLVAIRERVQTGSATLSTAAQRLLDMSRTDAS